MDDLSPRSATATLLIEEVKSIDGVDVFIRLEGLGGSRRRISGGLHIEAPPRAVWDVLTNYSALSEYIPNIAESGARVQPDGRVRIEQVLARPLPRRARAAQAGEVLQAARGGRGERGLQIRPPPRRPRRAAWVGLISARVEATISLTLGAISLLLGAGGG